MSLSLARSSRHRSRVKRIRICCHFNLTPRPPSVLDAFSPINRIPSASSAAINFISESTFPRMTPSHGRISFVFDSMEKLQIADFQYAFELFQETCPNAEVKARLDKRPHCEDDKKVPQLQAADLWAGLVRASVIPDKGAQAFLRKIAIPNRAFLWDQQYLVQLLSKSIKRTPEITSGKYREQPAQRKKRLKHYLLSRSIDQEEH